MITAAVALVAAIGSAIARRAPEALVALVGAAILLLFGVLAPRSTRPSNSRRR